MRPTINLYLKFAFTSLSPYAMPISLGIVSDTIKELVSPSGINPIGIVGYESKWIEKTPSKSFYAEFSDFDINRCDDWVKDNVISKLIHGKKETVSGFHIDNIDICKDTSGVKEYLKSWLRQFSDYNIQIVVDCGTWDWYWMVQLLDERPERASVLLIPDICIPDGMTGKEFVEEFKTKGNVIFKDKGIEVRPIVIEKHQFGFPKLPKNISPVPFDLNDLISIKKEISPREAFRIIREELMFSLKKKYGNDLSLLESNIILSNIPSKYNSKWDSEVIKEIYQKLK